MGTSCVLPKPWFSQHDLKWNLCAICTCVLWQQLAFCWAVTGLSKSFKSKSFWRKEPIPYQGVTVAVVPHVQKSSQFLTSRDVISQCFYSAFHPVENMGDAASVCLCRSAVVLSTPVRYFTASAVSVLPPGWRLRLTITQPLGWGQRERNCNSEGFHQIQAPNSSLFYSVHLEDDILAN